MIVGIWGDSITFGACDSEALGWVGRLQKILPEDDSSHIYNFGICGETSADVLKRFQIEFDAIKPEKVFLAFGINDSKILKSETENFIPLDDYRRNIQKLVDGVRLNGGETVLVGPTAVGGGSVTVYDSVFRDDEIVKYRDALKVIAEENGLKFIDMFDVLDPITDLADDGIHPNTAGYQKMFERIKSELDWI